MRAAGLGASFRNTKTAGALDSDMSGRSAQFRISGWTTLFSWRPLMNRCHPALILALVSVGWLAACSRENTAAAETAAAAGPADDPCTIVTDKQVHQVLGQ